MSILLSHEALPSHSESCRCGSGAPAIYVCGNCHGVSSHCRECILSSHHRMPLHRIKRWNGKFMEEVSLSKLGLVTSFGHNGDPCPTATLTHPLDVLHIDGFHKITIGYCACSSSLPYHLQLFDGKLFPASIDQPKTVFTFELLCHYQIHHLEGKGSAYTYIQSLYRLTNDEGLSDIPVSVVSPLSKRLTSSGPHT